MSVLSRSRCTFIFFPDGIADPPGAEIAHAAAPPSSRRASGSRRLQHGCHRAGTLRRGQGRSAAPASCDAPEPAVPSQEYSGRYPSFASNRDRGIIFPDRAHKFVHPSCKNDRNTLCRVYFSSPPQPPFPEFAVLFSWSPQKATADPAVPAASAAPALPSCAPFDSSSLLGPVTA